MAIDRDIAPCDVCRTRPARVLWSDVAMCLGCLAALDRRLELQDLCMCVTCLQHAHDHEEVG